MNFDSLYIKNNLIYLTEAPNLFSDIYIKVRNKEKRILTDKEVVSLPRINCNEWELREKSTKRFIDYLSLKKTSQKILEVGCGNGWFCSAMAKVSDINKVMGLDINIRELEQATRVFKRENLQFVYADIFNIESQFKNQFDIIVLNASVQYFSNFKVLIDTLESFLKPNGEIHIIDSPFYKTHQINSAKKRTLAYYTQLGFPDMANYYFHHSLDDLSKFKTLYNCKKNFLKRIFGRKDSPFSWYFYTKTKLG